MATLDKTAAERGKTIPDQDVFMKFVRVLSIATIALGSTPALASDQSKVPMSIAGVNLGDTYVEVRKKTSSAHFQNAIIEDCHGGISHNCALWPNMRDSKPFLVMDGVPFWSSIYFDDYHRVQRITLVHETYNQLSVIHCANAYAKAVDYIKSPGFSLSPDPVDASKVSHNMSTPGGHPFEIAMTSPLAREVIFRFSPQVSPKVVAPLHSAGEHVPAMIRERSLVVSGYYEVKPTKDYSVESGCFLKIDLTAKKQ